MAFVNKTKITYIYNWVFKELKKLLPKELAVFIIDDVKIALFYVRIPTTNSLLIRNFHPRTIWSIAICKLIFRIKK